MIKYELSLLIDEKLIMITNTELVLLHNFFEKTI